MKKYVEAQISFITTEVTDVITTSQIICGANGGSSIIYGWDDGFIIS